jgi:hypothetical protein
MKNREKTLAAVAERRTKKRIEAGIADRKVGRPS